MIGPALFFIFEKVHAMILFAAHQAFVKTLGNEGVGSGDSAGGSFGSLEAISLKIRYDVLFLIKKKNDML